MSNQQPSRRKFLTGAAATGAATLGFPAIVKAQGPISMRWQSTWPSKDIFHEYALDYAKKVNDMTGGDLKIEVLPAGAGGGPLRPLAAGPQNTPGRGPPGAAVYPSNQKTTPPAGAGPALRPGCDPALP